MSALGVLSQVPVELLNEIPWLQHDVDRPLFGIAGVSFAVRTAHSNTVNVTGLVPTSKPNGSFLFRSNGGDINRNG